MFDMALLWIVDPGNSPVVSIKKCSDLVVECFITFLMHPWWHCSMRTDDGVSSEYNPLRAVHNPLKASTMMQMHQFNSLFLIDMISILLFLLFELTRILPFNFFFLSLKFQLQFSVPKYIFCFINTREIPLSTSIFYDWIY